MRIRRLGDSLPLSLTLVLLANFLVVGPGYGTLWAWIIRTSNETLRKAIQERCQRPQRATSSHRRSSSLDCCLPHVPADTGRCSSPCCLFMHDSAGGTAFYS
ncbi:hypothetical protein BC567DRAFT_222336 [Phyllosticta citribraziliensis]